MGVTTVSDQVLRAARQHLHTVQLLAVDVAPGARMAQETSLEATHGAVAGADEARVLAPVGGRAQDKAAALERLRERYAKESRVAQSIRGWTNIVFGDGDPDAELMFIGEAPGADEDVQGIPFVGRAGQKLNEMIKAMGFAREGVYIANVLKVRPPNNRTPTPDEAASDGVFLEEQIRIVAPRAIVALGKPASNYLLGSTDSMGSMRGRWHAWNGIPLMPTYHPAYLLRSYTPENRRRIWSDLQQVVQMLGSAPQNPE